MYRAIIVGAVAALLPGMAWAQLKSMPVSVFNAHAATDGTNVDEGPSSVCDGSGHCVTVWTTTFNVGGTKGGDRDPVLARSSDYGATWTGTSVLNANASTDGGSADEAAWIATDGNGTWVTVWQSTNDFGATIGTDYDILAARSTDNGATWSAVMIVNSTAAGDSGSADTNPTVAWTGGANWIATWNSAYDLGGTIGTEGNILYAVSSDGGATWSATAVLNSDTATIDGTSVDQSPRVAGDGGGHAVVVWTSSYNLGGTIGTDNDIFYRSSADNGATWSATAALNSSAATDGGSSDFDPVVTTDKNGVWIASWRSQWGPTGGDNEIIRARSTDNGATWGTASPVSTTAAADSGANDGEQRIVASGAGNFAVVWNSTLASDGNSDADILVSVTNDGGVTWSGVTYLHDTAYNDGTSVDDTPTVAGGGDLSYTAFWRSTNTLGGTIGTDTDLFSIKFTPDFTAPDTVSVVPIGTGPTSADSLSFTVTFDQDVTGFSATADVNVSHAGTAHTGVVFSGGPAVYTVQVNGITGDGVMSLGTLLGTGVVNNLGVALGSTLNSADIIIDNTPPAATGIVPATSGPTNADSVDFTVTFDDMVTGFNDSADLVFSHIGTAHTGVSISGGPSVYTVSITGISGDGSFTLAVNTASDVVDDVAFALASSVTSGAVSIDNTPPTPVLSATAGDPVGGPFTVSVDTGEAATDFEAGNISLTNGSVSDFTGAGNAYSFTLSPSASPASVSIGAGVYTDAAGNANLVSNTVSRAYDATLPSASNITPSTTGPTNDTSVDFTVVFDEPVQNFNDAADLVIAHSGTAHTGVSISGGPSSYTVSVSGISGTGSFTLAASTSSDVKDLTNNPLGASVTSAAVVIDNSGPVFSNVVATPSDAYAGQLVSISFESDEPVSGIADVLVNGHPATSAKSLHGYEYEVQISDPLGPATISISGMDALGNAGSFSTSAALNIGEVPVSVPVAAWPVAAALAMAGAALARRRK